MVTLKQRIINVKRAARKRGLGISADKRLSTTPYRAMNPRAARELKQPTIRRACTYDPRFSDPNGCKSKQKMFVLDTSHELIEFDEMGKGKRYKTAHKIANRKQRSFANE